ncbi:acyltransferase [Pseudoxanthomonas winnipegensis]|jgi:peptidoglycan/LPS O-acetylase OafA/YrhL|uniref:Acyltransferase n=1 Tax=Pseudoxanthomonas winnipegensis TaxID=2480810 RepID=A0ABY1W8T2_9GAMM|nr:acyltransferase [Pseudoxanthomonas winnipegensis]TAA06716.1 acyltransferase [Pseudoxanthomonas winnipegensis]TAA16157.1 acyltransferase [Pseudoxanthomonas winnipegensis]TAH69640.1 acyltransferase [Pseudoxanthomonas winnipegensis]
MIRTDARYPGLDLLRAIAIVWVMFFHAWVVGGLAPEWTWLSRYGWMGVDLFFVLSGFLIGGQVLAPLSRGQPLRFGDFYLRRAFRILPAYWVVLALYALVPAWRERPEMEPLWKFVLMVMNLGNDYSRPAFSHAWSLCVEEHFYLVFPVLAWWLMRRPAAWKVALLAALVLVGGIALRAGIWLHNTAAETAGAAPRNWFIEDLYYPTWNRLDGLLCGVLLATLKTFRPALWAHAQRYANGALVAGLAVMALALWMFGDRTGLVGNAVGWPVLSIGLALLVFVGAGRSSLIGRWALPGAAWLAGVSYSLYLVHKAVFVQVQDHLGQAIADWGDAQVLVYGGASLLAAALLHYAVERPFLRLRGRVLRPRTTPMPATDAA